MKIAYLFERDGDVLVELGLQYRQPLGFGRELSCRQAYKAQQQTGGEHLESSTSLPM